MKKLLFISLILFHAGPSFSQDTITFRSGEVIISKVLEITPAEIKYKKYSNLEGPLYSVNKTDIKSINYVNGNIENYDGTIPEKSDTVQNSDLDLYMKGQIDAAIYYHDYKNAGAGTLVLSLLSPILGLIPATICSVTSPQPENLNYPSDSLFQIPAYQYGYTNHAKRVRKTRVWENWGIAFGVNLVATFTIYYISYVKKNRP